MVPGANQLGLTKISGPVATISGSNTAIGLENETGRLEEGSDEGPHQRNRNPDRSERFFEFQQESSACGAIGRDARVCAFQSDRETSLE